MWRPPGSEQKSQGTPEARDLNEASGKKRPQPRSHPGILRSERLGPQVRAGGEEVGRRRTPVTARPRHWPTSLQIKLRVSSFFWKLRSNFPGPWDVGFSKSQYKFKCEFQIHQESSFSKYVPELLIQNAHHLAGSLCSSGCPPAPGSPEASPAHSL